MLFPRFSHSSPSYFLYSITVFSVKYKQYHKQPCLRNSSSLTLLYFSPQQFPPYKIIVSYLFIYCLTHGISVPIYFVCYNNFSVQNSAEYICSQKKKKKNCWKKEEMERGEKALIFCVWISEEEHASEVTIHF